MTIFKELLAIKRFREEKAELALRRQRIELQAAVQARDGARRQLDDYRVYAQEQEQAMYADLCRRLVNLREIEHVQGSVIVLRGQEREHEGRLEQAEALRESQEHLLEERKSAHQLASRMKEKFVQLAQAHAEQLMREVERKEDHDLEEAAEARRDREDWENPESTSP